MDALLFKTRKKRLPIRLTFCFMATGFFVVLPNLNKDFSMVVSGGKTTTETTTETILETTTETTTGNAALNEGFTIAEKVGKTAAKIYRMISLNSQVTAAEIARKMQISENGVRYHIKKIKAAGLARFVGNPKSGHWEVSA